MSHGAFEQWGLSSGFGTLSDHASFVHGTFTLETLEMLGRERGSRAMWTMWDTFGMTPPDQYSSVCCAEKKINGRRSSCRVMRKIPEPQKKTKKIIMGQP
jgi:hypothetical protein